MSYKSHSLWDEEKDKYDIDTGAPGGGYRSSDGSKSDEYQSSLKYDKNEQDDVYGSKDKEEDKDKKKKEKEKSEFEKALDEHDPRKKYQKKEDEEEVVKKKAAEEVFREMEKEKQKVNQNSKSSKTIEDAINKAVKEEKEVIHLN